ncbi:MAG: hypothetical protein R3E64_06260 [Halioglobus sp.]
MDVVGKVVVDSGSNSHYAIDAPTLSALWNKPTLVIADSASYPLRNKIFNLKKYLNKGDVLILPLEWHYYMSSDDVASVFLSRLMDENLTLEYYFNSLPATERLRFIFTQLPLRNVLSALLMPREGEALLLDEMESLVNFEETLRKRDNESFGGSVQQVADQTDAVAASMRCDTYVHSVELVAGKAKLSKTFLADLELLRDLVDAGIEVYFTWPAVVDRDISACYTDVKVKKAVMNFADELVSAVAARGFTFIGDIESAHFDDSCFLDTYYHLRHSCAIQRTEALADALDKAGVHAAGDVTKQDDLIEVALDYGVRIQQKLLNERFAMLPALESGSIDRSELQHRASVVAGWYPAEQTGIWSRGDISVIELKIDPQLLDQEFITLTIDGRYNREGAISRIAINDEDFGAYDSAERSYAVDTARIKGQRITVTLHHQDVASPAQLGVSRDSRSLHFLLRSLSIQ